MIDDYRSIMTVDDTVDPWTCTGYSSVKTLSGLVQSHYQHSRNALEHVTLTLWQQTRPLVVASASKPEESQAILEELVQVSDKVWNRLGLLLFASNEWTVKAIIGLIENLANASTSSDTLNALDKRILRSEWKQYMMDKIRYCHEATLQQAQQSHPRRPITYSNTSQTKLGVDHVMSLRLLDACVKITLRQEEDALEAKDLVLLVDLLLYLVRSSSSSSIEKMSIYAMRQILKLVVVDSMKTRAFLLDQLNHSGLFETILNHLQQKDQVFQQQQPHHHYYYHQQQQLSTVNRRGGIAGRGQEEEEEEDTKEVEDLSFLEFQLLTKCIQQAKGAHLSFYDKSSSFLSTICHLLTCPEPKWQLQTLTTLEALLILSNQVDTSSLTSQLRINGYCMTLSWLLVAPDRNLRQAAHRVLKLIIEISPRVEIVRALVEQGCVVILEIVHHHHLQQQQKALDSASASDSDSDEKNHQILLFLLNWIREVMDERLVSVLMTSITRSSNVLLQKNIILGLFILATIRPKLTNSSSKLSSTWNLYGFLLEKEFIQDTVASVVQQHSIASSLNIDTSLAVALLKFFYTTIHHVGTTNKQPPTTTLCILEDTVDVLMVKEGMDCFVSIKRQSLYRYCPALRPMLVDQKTIDLSLFSLQSIYFLKEVVEEVEESNERPLTIQWMTLARMKRFTFEQMIDLMKLAHHIQSHEFKDTIACYLLEIPGFFQLDTWYPLCETASQVDALVVIRQSIQFAIEKYEETIAKSFSFHHQQQQQDEESATSLKLCTQLRQAALMILEYLFIKLEPPSSF